MSVFSRVTVKTLLKNRVRTVVTVIGIILSAAMITAVTTSVSSFTDYLRQLSIYRDGLWHGAFYSITPEQAEKAVADERFDSAANAQVMGWYDTSGGKAGGFVYLLVLGGDDTFFERMPLTLTEGRLPQSPDEIVLRGSSLFAEDIELGDRITLSLGDRYLNGEVLSETDYWKSGEELEVRLEREYTVVGFIVRPSFEISDTPGTVAYTLWDESFDAPYLDSYFLLKDPRDTFLFQSDWAAEGLASAANSDYLMTLGISMYDTFYSLVYRLAAVLIAIIMFGSVSLIYNAFSISVAERTRQFGLLRSVGATKKQLRGMVFTEALAVSTVGIPLGILSGVAGMAVTFRFLGDALAGLLSGTEAEALSLRIHVSALSIVLAAAIGLVTVLISAWIPSRRAMRVSAVEAIRQSADVRIKRREVRTSPLTYRLFGLEGAIAGKHFKRDRKRYRATVVSLFMSVVLFISASSFCRYIVDSAQDVFEDYGYDVEVYGFTNFTEEYGNTPGLDGLGSVIDALSDVPCVTGWSAVTSLGTCYMTLGREQVTEEAWENVANGGASGGRSEEDGLRVGFHIFGVEDETYRAFLRKNGLSEEEFMGEDPKVIVRPSLRSFNASTQRLEVLDTLREDLETVDIALTDEAAADAYFTSEEFTALSDEEQARAREEHTFETVFTFEIGYMTDELPLGLNSSWEQGYVTVLLPMSEARRLLTREWDQWEMYFTVSDRDNGAAALEAAYSDAGFDPKGVSFDDIYERTRFNRDLITVVRVLSYGFIALISAIAAVNVFNTVSTNVLLRRREFAMLRSVGMTRRGFNRMMNFECLLYGAKSLAFGIPAAFGVTYLIYSSVTSAIDTDFYLPWGAVAIAVGSVFLVVFLSMMYSMAVVRRDNPVEAMRNEVI